MKKRLRKKLRKGEFRELGFNVWIETQPLDPEGHIVFWNDWVTFLEERGLGCGGGGRDGYESLYIAALDGRRRVVVDDDRLVVARWLDARPEIRRVAVGLLEDAWHPPRDSWRTNPLRASDG